MRISTSAFSFLGLLDLRLIDQPEPEMGNKERARERCLNVDELPTRPIFWLTFYDVVFIDSIEESNSTRLKAFYVCDLQHS